MPVLKLESTDSEETYQIIKSTAEKALAIDDAEIICLGCAGMTGMDKRLQEELNIPVLDGVICALKIAEGLVGYHLHTSKKRLYKKPNKKPLLNLPDIFDRGYV